MAGYTLFEGAHCTKEEGQEPLTVRPLHYTVQHCAGSVAHDGGICSVEDASSDSRSGTVREISGGMAK